MTHGGGEHSLRMSALELSRFGCNDVLKVGRKRVTQSMNESVSDKAVCNSPGYTESDKDNKYQR